MSNDALTVKNPHSILAALRRRPKDVLELSLPRDQSDEVWKEIIELAAAKKIKTKNAGDGGSFARESRGAREHRDARDQKSIGRESAHGALLKPCPPTSVEALWKGIDSDSRGVWLALDSLQDPQNLGAIFRSAAFFGVKGIVMTSERSAPMTSTVYDISSGGVESVPYVPVINLQRAFEKAKEAGLWILGTSEHAKEPLRGLKADRPWLVVVGNEEKGLRRLTLDSCDVTCGIPPVGEGVTSLNVSVATGVILAHLRV